MLLPSIDGERACVVSWMSSLVLMRLKANKSEQFYSKIQHCVECCKLCKCNSITREHNSYEKKKRPRVCLLIQVTSVKFLGNVRITLGDLHAWSTIYLEKYELREFARKALSPTKKQKFESEQVLCCGKNLLFFVNFSTQSSLELMKHQVEL